MSVPWHKCIRKDHYKEEDRNPCISCEVMNDGCPYRHIIIDSNLVLNKYLGEGDVTLAEEVLGLVREKKAMPIMTTIQVGHVMRRFIEEFRTIETTPGSEINKEESYDILQSNYKECMELLKDFQVLDFCSRSQDIYEELQDCDLRMEDHDMMNVAIAMVNNLDFEARDGDLEDDWDKIREVCDEELGYTIKINHHR